MESNNSLNHKELKYFISAVYSHTGITIDESKKNLLESRLRSRIRTLKLNSYKGYIDYLDTNSKETESFINLVTTNESYFFRTQRIWNYITDEYLPKFKDTKSKINIWSAASSTGEEAYSLAVILEDFKSKNINLSYQITGTDISSKVINFANKGLYNERAIKNFEKYYPEFYKKFIEKKGDEYKVANALKRNVEFKVHNLFDNLKPPKKFQLVLLRNVMIYFNKEDREKVLKNIYDMMDHNTVLIIGESESLSNHDTKFVFLHPQIYLKE